MSDLVTRLRSRADLLAEFEEDEDVSLMRQAADRIEALELVEDRNALFDATLKTQMERLDAWQARAEAAERVVDAANDYVNSDRPGHAYGVAEGILTKALAAWRKAREGEK
jgi:ElaB/YqjD/DUF883 family membrane-anchored ribosome-binding protein